MQPQTNISREDLISLDHLSLIKPKQVIDIYENGTISDPYDQGTVASAWRTTRWLTGYGQNRDDMPHVKKLMERAFHCYLRGDNFLEEKLQNSVTGLKNLKNSYALAKKETTTQEIDKIIAYVETNLVNLKKMKEESCLNFNFKVKNDEMNRLALLEASCLNAHGVKDNIQGLHYYVDKINTFLLTEKVNEEEREILESIREALVYSSKLEPLKGVFFTQEVSERVRKRVGKDVTIEEWNQAYKDVENQMKGEYVEARLRELDSLNENEQSRNGIFISMAYSYPDGGHVYCLSICKEKDGSYTVSQINAGGLSIGEIVKVNLHLNVKKPLSVSIPTVVEFGPLDREEAKNFIVQAIDSNNKHFPSIEEAANTYYSPFMPFFDKRRPDRIPPRRVQVSGNCGVRSVKEMVTFSLQKWGRPDLANRLMKFTDSRMSGTSLPYEEVMPLKS